MTAALRIFSVSEYVRPGQEIATHVHPHGQDTWTVLSGSADYYQGSGVVTKLKAGDIAVAKTGQVHGARNADLTEPFIFVSVVALGIMPAMYWLKNSG